MPGGSGAAMLLDLAVINLDLVRSSIWLMRSHQRVAWKGPWKSERSMFIHLGNLE
jgi:hypothetical protein